MSLSSPFIRRPVATTLLTIGIALTGLLAYAVLPVAPLPKVDFPTISVQASLPGASPETMAATVATPLERSLGRIAGITEMTSSSSLGSTRVTLQFDLSRDIDGAARDVQAAINAARSLLPTGLPSNPTYRKVNPADAPIMIIAMTSATLDQGQMYDAGSTVLAQTLSQVDGVGEVDVGGSSLPAVRIEADPAALNRYAIGLEQVRVAIVASNANRPKGAIEDANRHWQIAADDQLMRAADYRPLIVAWNKGAPVRLEDVAVVSDSVQDLHNAGMADGHPAVLLIIRRQPGANVIATVDRVKAILPQLRASIPAAIDLRIASDSTTTIRASLRDVKGTLLVSVVLVILVVFLFLRRWRAATIPAVAVPVSLIGTFAIMYLAGFSIDNLSLMALTIATGFVVDDAVVVLENASRHIEQGMKPLDAALQSASEVGFTVLSMSTSLVAVFVPILLMGGVVGRLLHEFAVTLSAAILVSLVVSLTTTPMMCAHVLRAEAEHPPGRLSRAIGSAFDRLHDAYAKSLAWALDHHRLTVAALAATVGLTVYLYIIVPKGFMPQQDTGRLNGSLQADQSISFQAMRAKLKAFDAILRADPAVEHVVAFTGGGQRNSANFFVALKPLAERHISSDLVIARLRRQMSRVPGANLFLQSVQDVRVGGRAANAQYQYTLSSDVLADLQTWAPRVQRALATVPEITDVNSDQQQKGLQTSLVVDRNRAAELGVSMSQLDATLDDLYGQRLVSTIYNPLNQYRVVLEAAPPNLERPEELGNTYVMSTSGAVVPLVDFAHWEPTNTSLAVNHQGQFVATTLSFNLAPGASLSTAANSVAAAVAALQMPPTIHGSFQGTAQAFQASLANQPLLILAALITIYIVLGVLYESLVHPLTILSTLPSASGGAILALLVTRTEFSIIAFIGVMLLIGIVKKNAILMIDFAVEEQRRNGTAAREAIYRASLLRFRPILMTTMAAMLGAVPLALGHGEGAELRQPLGISIVGGLLVSQLLTLYTTPVVYLYLERFGTWASRLRIRELRTQFALIVLAGLSGCAVGPGYHAPSIPVPPAYKESADWVPANPRDQEPRGAWWQAFGDSTLDRLESQVELSNTNLAIAEAQYRQALAQAGIATSALFPTIQADASATRGTLAAHSGTGAPPAVNLFSAGLSAAWELDLWGKFRRAHQSARASAQASAADLESARLSVHALLAQTYFAMRTVEADEQVINNLAQGYEQTLKITQNQYTVGVAAHSDVDAAVAQLKQTQAQGIDLEAQRAQLEHALAVLLGRFPADFGVAPAESLTAAPTPPAVLPSDLLMRRPDVAAAERRLAASSAQIGVAAAGYFPSLSLSGSASTQASETQDLFKAPTELWAVGASLAQPIFEAGRTRAAVAGARAGYDQSLAEYRQAVLGAFQDVEDQLASMRVLAEEAGVQSEAVDAARQALDRTLNQYKAGTVSHINVVIAQVTLLNAERSEVDLAGRRLETAVALYKATGGGWERDAKKQM